MCGQDPKRSLLNISGLQDVPARIVVEEFDERYIADLTIGEVKIELSFDDSDDYYAELPKAMINAMREAKNFVITLPEGDEVKCLFVEHDGFMFILVKSKAILVDEAGESKQASVQLRDDDWDSLFPEEE